MLTNVSVKTGDRITKRISDKTMSKTLLTPSYKIISVGILAFYIKLKGKETV